MRLLVVDDDPLLLKSLRDTLESDGHQVVAASSADEAVERLAACPDQPDLIISDFRMRQVDGIEVLTAARGHHPDGLRVLMTGYNEIPTSMDRIRQAKIDAYVQKPLRSQDILLLIFDFLNGNRSAIDACRQEARELETMGSHETTGSPAH